MIMVCSIMSILTYAERFFEYTGRLRYMMCSILFARVILLNLPALQTMLHYLLVY